MIYQNLAAKYGGYAHRCINRLITARRTCTVNPPIPLQIHGRELKQALGETSYLSFAASWMDSFIPQM